MYSATINANISRQPTDMGSQLLYNVTKEREGRVHISSDHRRSHGDEFLDECYDTRTRRKPGANSSRGVPLRCKPMHTIYRAKSKKRLKNLQSLPKVQSSVSVSYKTTKSVLGVEALLPPLAGVAGVGVGSSRGSSKASECAELRDGLEGTSTMDKSESSLPTSERVSVVAVIAVLARVAVAARGIGPTDGADDFSGAAWGIVIKEEEESAPSSSEEFWGSLTVISAHSECPKWFPFPSLSLQ